MINENRGAKKVFRRADGSGRTPCSLKVEEIGDAETDQGRIIVNYTI